MTIHLMYCIAGVVVVIIVAALHLKKVILDVDQDQGADLIPILLVSIQL